VDYAWPEVRVALDCDTPDSASADDDPHHRGWTVVRADAQDLADPTALCGRLRAAFGEHRVVAA
jgi:hypothetical protein